LLTSYLRREFFTILQFTISRYDSIIETTAKSFRSEETKSCYPGMQLLPLPPCTIPKPRNVDLIANSMQIKCSGRAQNGPCTSCIAHRQICEFVESTQRMHTSQRPQNFARRQQLCFSHNTVPAVSGSSSTSPASVNREISFAARPHQSFSRSEDEADDESYLPRKGI
jgi:hypothetical protein